MTAARVTALAQLDKARAAIEKCSNVSETQEIAGQIKAVLAYMKTKGEKSLKVVRRAQALLLDTRIKQGEISKKLDKAVGREGFGADNKSTPNKKEALAEAGLSQKQAWRDEELADFAKKHPKEVAAAIQRADDSKDERVTASGELAKAIVDEGRAQRAKELGAPSLPRGRYSIILADPPWKFSNQSSSSRQIDNQYPTMTLDDISALAVETISTEDAALFLWIPSSMLPDGLQVMKAWGFSYKAMLVWVKDKIGMGFWARGRHEPLLIGARGKMPPPIATARPDSVIEAPRTAHSVKPETSYAIIEAMYPEAKRVELFARGQRKGWKAWGNEI